MQRYFIKKDQLIDGIVSIGKQDYFHITAVMRMKVFDKIIICFSNKESYLSQIVEINKKNVLVKLNEELNENNELKNEIQLAHALVKQPKQEEVIKRIVELGAKSYQCVKLLHCINTINYVNMDRMNLIIKEASEQSCRNELLEYKNMISLDEYIKDSSIFTNKLFAYEKAKNLLDFKNDLKNGSTSVLVGPEGGFSIEEVNKLIKANFTPFSLGRRILRTETAAIHVISLLTNHYEAEK